MRVLGALTLAACGLISKDVLDVTLRLPEKSFTIDADAWNLPAGNAPAIACTAGCSTAKSALCGSATCSADCDGTNCQAHITLSVSQSYDLGNEASDWRMLGSQASFGVDTIAMKVSSNTLDFATPEMSIFLSPPSGTPELVGTLAPIPAGATGTFDVAFAAGGQAVMKKYLFDDYKNAFVAVVSGTSTVKAGDPTPRGKLVGAIAVTAHAGP